MLCHIFIHYIHIVYYIFPPTLLMNLIHRNIKYNFYIMGLRVIDYINNPYLNHNMYVILILIIKSILNHLK